MLGFCFSDVRYSGLWFCFCAIASICSPCMSVQLLSINYIWGVLKLTGHHFNGNSLHHLVQGIWSKGEIVSFTCHSVQLEWTSVHFCKLLSLPCQCLHRAWLVAGIFQAIEINFLIVINVMKKILYRISKFPEILGELCMWKQCISVSLLSIWAWERARLHVSQLCWYQLHQLTYCWLCGMKMNLTRLSFPWKTGLWSLCLFLCCSSEIMSWKPAELIAVGKSDTCWAHKSFEVLMGFYWVASDLVEHWTMLPAAKISFS